MDRGQFEQFSQFFTPLAVNSGQIAQLLTALGFGAVAVAIINWLANRKKTGAETAVVLSGEARAWASAAMERVARAEARADEIEKNSEQRMQRVEAKAEGCQSRVRQLEDHIEDLHDIIERLGGEPPPMP